MEHTLHIQLSSAEGAIIRALGLIERRGFTIMKCSVDESERCGLVMDVTDKKAVKDGMDSIVRECGGLDILVPNAGLAHVATLEDLDEKKFRQVTEVNTMGVFQVIQAAIPVFKRQAMLGEAAAHIVINSSKNVFAPGAAFGAYSSSKAAAHQLGKIAAMELAPFNVRVNMINADAIFDDHGVSSGLWDVIGPDRMRSRNLDPEGFILPDLIVEKIENRKFEWET